MTLRFQRQQLLRCVDRCLANSEPCTATEWRIYGQLRNLGWIVQELPEQEEDQEEDQEEARRRGAMRLEPDALRLASLARWPYARLAGRPGPLHLVLRHRPALAGGLLLGPVDAVAEHALHLDDEGLSALQVAAFVGRTGLLARLLDVCERAARPQALLPLLDMAMLGNRPGTARWLARRLGPNAWLCCSVPCRSETRGRQAQHPFCALRQTLEADSVEALAALLPLLQGDPLRLRRAGLQQLGCTVDVVCHARSEKMLRLLQRECDADLTDALHWGLRCARHVPVRALITCGARLRGVEGFSVTDQLLREFVARSTAERPRCCEEGAPCALDLGTLTRPCNVARLAQGECLTVLEARCLPPVVALHLAHEVLRLLLGTRFPQALAELTVGYLPCEPAECVTLLSRGSENRFLGTC